MTTTTFTAMNGSLVQAPTFAKPSFAQIRASLPDMPEQGSLVANAANVASRLALAAVPFAGLGWLFFAR
jgi:hypothetical protein